MTDPIYLHVNLLPGDKIIDFSVLKVFAYNTLTLYHMILTCNNPKKEDFQKHCGGKGENAGDQHFSPFPTMFSSDPKSNFSIFKLKKFCLL